LRGLVRLVVELEDVKAGIEGLAHFEHMCFELETAA
jgi:hypothetical protein